MATREFKLPDVGEGVAEGTLESWLVDVGDRVTEDQPLAEVETDKALVEVPSPVDATIKELRAEPGDVIPVGDVFVVFQLDDEAGAEAGAGGGDEGEAADAPEAGGESEAGEAPSTGADPGAADAADEATGDEPDDATADTGGRVFAAPSTRRLARELGVDIGAVEGTGPGGRITDADVRAAANGTESAVAAEAGDEDDAGQATATAGSTAEAEAEAAAVEADTGAGAGAGDGSVAGAGVDPAGRDRTLAVPATRRVAREAGVDIDDVPAVDHREGEAFVTADAVREYAEAQRRAQESDAAAVAEADSAAGSAATSTAPSAEDGTAGADAAEAGVDRTVPYTGVRRSIGKAMERSKYTAPHVTHHDDVDVTDLVATRERLKSVAEEEGIRLTYMPFVMKACVAALREFPYLNAQLDEENDEILLRGDYNVGVATATDVGLMVPVVEGVDRKGLLQIASETNELVSKARERSIAREEMEGGTFTVTNVGGIGGEYATPIINHPEVAILALGEIKQRPRVVDGEVVARHTLPLSLSFDHRVVDGAMAARFVNEVKRYLADPDLLLLE